jgi:hypothetical protein
VPNTRVGCTSILRRKEKNGRLANELLFDHYLGPNNVGNMANAAETKLYSTLYNGEKKFHMGNLCAHPHRETFHLERFERVWIL